MTEHNMTRRRVIQASAWVAGVTAAGTTLAVEARPGSTLGAEAEARLLQREYIAKKLERITKSSRTVTPEEIRNFAAAFTKVHGLVDYRKMFSRLDGEYRLGRLFVESMLLFRS